MNETVITDVPTTHNEINLKIGEKGECGEMKVVHKKRYVNQALGGANHRLNLFSSYVSFV